MPIAIECDQCHQSYKVDDRLAGKTVKCKNCSQLIRVPGAGPEEAPEECISCGQPMSPGVRACKACGFNRQTGQKTASFLDNVLDDKSLAARKNSRWVRTPGNALLESLDELVKLLVVLMLVGGIVVAIVHVAKSPDGFSFLGVLPTLVVLGLLTLIMAPLTTLAINMTVRALKLPPRDDTYGRVAICALLPFAFSLLSGWPEMAENWGWVPMLGWPAAIGLLIYYFRGLLLEWVASVAVAAVAILISLLFMNLAMLVITSAAGPLYGDMLPRGPWVGLATGHSPEPQAAPSRLTPPELVATHPAPLPISPTTPEIATTPPDLVPATQDVTPATLPTVAIGPTTQLRPPASRTATLPTAPPAKIDSAFFAEIIEHPDFKGVTAIALPPGATDTLLTIKNSDSTTEVQRWTLNPLTKKERLPDPPLYYAKKPPVFTLSSKGDTLVALSYFPSRKIEIISLDTKFPKKTIPLEDIVSLPTETVGILPGFLDANRFTIRWDFNGATRLQVVSSPGGVEVRRALSFDVSIPDSSCLLSSPNGKLMAIFGYLHGPKDNTLNQLLLFNMDNGQLTRRINVSDLAVRPLGMAFSPDSTQIAIYAAITDLPTVISFKVTTGEITCQNLLSQTPLDKDSPVIPHALVWLANNQAWLLNGNDLLDPATGKKFASLNLPGTPDIQNAGPTTVAIMLQNPDLTPRLILAKLDDSKLREAKAPK